MFKRIRGTCHEGNVCPTLMLDTETNEVLVQGPVLDPIKEAALRCGCPASVFHRVWRHAERDLGQNGARCT